MSQVRSERRFILPARASTLLLIVLLTGVTANVRAQDSAEVIRIRGWLDSHIPELMRESGLPGFSIALVKDGRKVYAEGFGARDPKKNLPATPDTL